MIEAARRYYDPVLGAFFAAFVATGIGAALLGDLEFVAIGAIAATCTAGWMYRVEHRWRDDRAQSQGE